MVKTMNLHYFGQIDEVGKQKNGYYTKKSFTSNKFTLLLKG